MSLDFRQFVMAREYRGLSQSDLAKCIEGLSQSNLSKFEKGFDVLSDNIKESIIQHLNFPVEFFRKRIYNTVISAHYRKKSSISKKLEKSIDITLKFIGHVIDEMAETVEWPTMILRGYDLENDVLIKTVALHVRKLLGVKPDEPIRNIYGLLEAAGILVVEYNPSPEFDGVSFYTDGGYPVIVVNGSFSNDRKRYTLAHELGHIVLHLTDNLFIPDHRDREKEAHEFAAEFLMPADELKIQLRHLKLANLMSLKQYWMTSMASIVRRAYDLGCIDKKRYEHFNIELSRSGFRKNEPGTVPIDMPKIFKKAYGLIKEHLNFNNEEMATLFTLPLESVNEFLNDQKKFGGLKIAL